MNIILPLACLSLEWPRRSIEIGYVAAAFAIGIALASTLIGVRRRSFDWLALFGLFLLLHPAWTMEIGADCGFGYRFFAIGGSIVLAAILVCQTLWPRLNKRKFLLVLCIVSWVLCFAVWPNHLWSGEGDPEGGFIDQFLLSFSAAGGAFPQVAITLTGVAFIACLFDWLRYTRSASEKPNDVSPLTAAPERRGSSKTVVRTVSLVALMVLVTLIFSYARSEVSLPFFRPLHPFHWIFVFDSGIAFTVASICWAVILVVTAVRGKFPGWEIHED